MKKKSVFKQLEEGLREGIEYSKGNKDLVTSHAENNIQGWVVINPKNKALPNTFSVSESGSLLSFYHLNKSSVQWEEYRNKGWKIVRAIGAIIVKLDDENDKKKK